MVSVTINITHASKPFEQANERELEVLNSIKHQLLEIGIHELSCCPHSGSALIRAGHTVL